MTYEEDQKPELTQITENKPVDSSIPVPDQHLAPNPEAIKAWLDQEPDPRFKAIKQKLIDNLQCVPHEVFISSLKRCVEQANEAIGDKPYAVLWDYKPHASKRWVYELAKDFLKPAPTEARYFGTYDKMEDFEDFRALLDKGIDTFVIMDDAIYSGEQFRRSALEHLVEVYKKFGYYPNRLPKIVLVAPYMTNFFKNQAYLRVSQEQGLIHVATEQTMPSLGEILSPEEWQLIQEERGGVLDLPGTGKQRGVADPNYDELYKHATLTAFDHRVADGHSFCEPLAFQLGLGAQKPYAKQSTDYWEKEELEFAAYQQPKLEKKKQQPAP